MISHAEGGLGHCCKRTCVSTVVLVEEPTRTIEGFCTVNVVLLSLSRKMVGAFVFIVTVLFVVVGEGAEIVGVVGVTVVPSVAVRVGVGETVAVASVGVIEPVAVTVGVMETVTVFTLPGTIQDASQSSNPPKRL